MALIREMLIMLVMFIRGEPCVCMERLGAHKMDLPRIKIMKGTLTWEIFVIYFLKVTLTSQLFTFPPEPF